MSVNIFKLIMTTKSFVFKGYNMKDLPIIALDFESANKVNTFLDQFDEPLFVKIGMELFYQAGPDLIKSIKSRGHDIFLDLKLHDIPNTVEKQWKA